MTSFWHLYTLLAAIRPCPTHNGPRCFHLQSPTFLSIATAMFHGPLMDAVAVEVDQKNVVGVVPTAHGPLQAACNPGATPIHLGALQEREKLV